MKNSYPAILLPAVVAAGCLFTVYLAIYRPGYLSNTSYLGGLIFLQVLLASLWRYRERFFPLLIVVFLWAGTAVPLREVWTSGRWFVLAVGAVIGYVTYMKDRNHHFGRFHLVAFSCILAALVSAVVSLDPKQAVLKTFSLLLLFLYAASGARVAIVGREDRFFRGLLLGCELLVYVTAVAHLVFHLAIFNSPNSLGAVMGVAVVPLMLWGMLISERTSIRRRRTLALLLSLFLLFFSLARAGIVAAAVSCVLLCLALRRYRLLVQGTATAVLLALLAVLLVPPRPEQSGSISSVLLYKGQREAGILGSRRSPWQQTLAVIRERPWFGSGFGTSSTTAEMVEVAEKYQSAQQTTREHGNSYLAITEWVGLLGVLPFFALVFLTAMNAYRGLAWMRRIGNPCHASVPVALILTAGVIHATFEDWLFAAGYYLCVFFWSLAFVSVDLLPVSKPALQPHTVWPSTRFAPGYGVVPPNP